jgi:hypothetical protein
LIRGRPGVKPRRALLHDEGADAGVGLIRIGLGIDHGDVGDGTVGDPHFGAVENIAVPAFFRRGGHGGHVGTGIGLGQPHAADPLSGSQLGNVLAALRLGAVAEKGVRT